MKLQLLLLLVATFFYGTFCYRQHVCKEILNEISGNQTTTPGRIRTISNESIDVICDFFTRRTAEPITFSEFLSEYVYDPNENCIFDELKNVQQILEENNNLDLTTTISTEDLCEYLDGTFDSDVRRLCDDNDNKTSDRLVAFAKEYVRKDCINE